MNPNQQPAPQPSEPQNNINTTPQPAQPAEQQASATPSIQEIATISQQQIIPQNSFQQPPQSKNKKKLLLILIPSILALVGASIFAFTMLKDRLSFLGGAQLEDYSNTTFGFSMKVPKGWTVKEQNEKYAKGVTFQEPAGDIKDNSTASTYYGTLIVNYSVANDSYDEVGEQEYFDYYKKSLQKTVSESGESSGDGYREKYAIEKDGIETINGLKGYKFKLKITNYKDKKDSVGYGYGLYLYVDKKTQYQIGLDAHESETVNSKADEILTSFVKK